MPSLSDITSTEFRSALTMDRLRVGMLIQFALAAGAIIYFFVVLFVLLTDHVNEPSPDFLEFFSLLTSITLIFFAIVSTVGYFIYKSYFTPARLEAAYAGNIYEKEGKLVAMSPSENAIAHIRTAMLIRTACFEASAFLGLEVLLRAAQNGVLKLELWPWVNAVPFLVLLGSVMLTFPTAGRMEQIFEERIKKAV